MSKSSLQSESVPKGQVADKANAFDLLRHLAALAVLYSHSFVLYGQSQPRGWSGQTWGSCAVYVFFSLSGYLVAQSWAHDPHAGRFALRRALRIFPALLTVLLLTVLVLGPCVTTRPLSDYLGASETWRYLLGNASLFYGVDRLPGVFEGNPFPSAVNGSLWTLCYEVTMYGVLTLVGVACSGIGVAARRLALPAATLLFVAANLYSIHWEPVGWDSAMPLLWRLGILISAARLAELGSYFLAGACCYELRHWIRPSLPGSVAAIVLLILTMPWPQVQILFAWLAVPYAVVGLAWKLPEVLRRGWSFDYSYGIYIYAFPAQQLVSMLGKQNDWPWTGVLAASVVLTLLLAMLSWHAVERVALRLKPSSPKSAQWPPALEPMLPATKRVPR